MEAEPLSERFWPAFEALVEQVDDERQLGYAYGFRASCGSRDGSCDPEALSRAIRQQIGREGWPITNPAALSDGDTALIMKLIAESVVYPEPEMCGWCDRYHIKFGREAADDFREAVNRIFTNLGLPFELRVEGLTHRRSALLSRLSDEIVTLTPDRSLADLLERAVDDFFNGAQDRRLAGLHTIVDAFERVKATFAANKRTSVERLVTVISRAMALHEPVEDIFRRLTDVANTSSIRHHEPSQRSLDDFDLIEFLFYNYLNVIRLSLRKMREAESAA